MNSRGLGVYHFFAKSRVTISAISQLFRRWDKGQSTRQNESNLKGIEALQQNLPFAPFATSDSRDWKGLQAARYRESLANWNGFLSHDASRLAAQVVNAAKSAFDPIDILINTLWRRSWSVLVTLLSDRLL